MSNGPGNQKANKKRLEKTTEGLGMEVRLEYLFPAEVERRKMECATLFIPLGTIEWHGLHNMVGLDAVKAHELCLRAARRGGGLVHPPVFGGLGGLDEPCTFVVEPEESLESHLLRPWLERLCSEAARNGFRAVILLTGHYGAAQQIAVREAAVRIMKIHNIAILGTPEYFLALDQQYYGDHAAFYETSIMMHLFPEHVDLARLGAEPHQGVYGKDPKQYASEEHGKRFCDAIVERLAVLASQMPSWDETTRLRFLRAEEALVSCQLLQAGRCGNRWAAWRHISDKSGVFDQYPELLTSGRFEEITEAVAQL